MNYVAAKIGNGISATERCANLLTRKSIRHLIQAFIMSQFDLVLSQILKIANDTKQSSVCCPLLWV